MKKSREFTIITQKNDKLVVANIVLGLDGCYSYINVRTGKKEKIEIKNVKVLI